MSASSGKFAAIFVESIHPLGGQVSTPLGLGLPALQNDGSLYSRTTEGTGEITTWQTHVG